MFAILVATWILILAYFSGKRLLNLLNIQPISFTARFSYAAGLGFGIFAYLVLFLGLIRCLYPWLVYLILIAFSGFLIFSKSRPKTEIIRTKFPAFSLRFIIPTFLLVSVLAIVVVVNILGALTPEVRHDSLQYHQTMPHYYLLEHRIAEVPYTIYYTYALNAEMIYTLGLVLLNSNSMVPKLFHCFAAIITAIAIYGVAKRYTSPHVALLSVVIFYTLPQVAWMSSSAFNENWWMLFGVLAIAVWLEWEQTGQKNWLILSAIFCGLGIGTKLIAILFYPFLLGIATIVRSQKSEVRSQKSESCLLLLASCFCFMLLPVIPWLVRNYVYTHNPIYPLLSSLFSSPYPYDIAGKNFAIARSLPAMSVSVILNRIWTAFSAINTNGNGILTAFFIVFIPLLLLKSVPRELKWLTGYGILAWLIYGIVEGGTDGRFIYPTYPILAISIAYAIYLAIERVPRYQNPVILLISIIMLGTFIHMKYIFVQDFHESWLPVLNQQKQAEYLSERIGIYSMFEYINKTLPQDARVLLPSGYAGLYCNRRYIGHSEFDISPLDDLITHYGSADKVYEHLRAWSITHLVIHISLVQNPILTDLLAKYGTKQEEIGEYELYALK